MLRRQLLQRLAGSAAAVVVSPLAILEAGSSLPEHSPPDQQEASPGRILIPLVWSTTWVEGRMLLTVYNPNDVAVAVDCNGVGRHCEYPVPIGAAPSGGQAVVFAALPGDREDNA